MSAIDLAADLVRRFEGCQLQAYADQAGVMTIGFGHTGPDVYEGLLWTQGQAEAALVSDLSIAAHGVSKLVPGRLTDKQSAALISMLFNLGTGSLKGSGLIKAINAGHWIEAAHEWVRWDHVGHTEIKGLLIRRLEEAAFFLRGSP